MQRDFHYYAIKALAQKAGFTADEAEIIAYSSEYVDDAVEYQEIELEKFPEIDFGRLSSSKFNPICTAHKGLQRIKAFSEDIQQKVYISFHFIPEIKENSVNFLTQPKNNLSTELIQNAIDEIVGKTGEERIQKLIKLGIAIHSYADTWSHQNFSGRHSSTENDIENIEILQGTEWVSISRIKDIELSAMPDIGHAEAHNFPDLSHLKWRYSKSSNKNLIIRDNTLLCMQAANNIFEVFKKITNSNQNWSYFDYLFLQCFNKKTEVLEEKYANFVNKFSDVSFNYDENKWKKDALEYIDKKWFYFHIEACNQRNYVLNRISNQKI